MGCGCGKKDAGHYYKPRVNKSSIKNNEPKTTQCDCVFSGQGSFHCTRHAMDKTQHLYGLCKTSQEYFDIWENCEDRMQECDNMIINQEKENYSENNNESKGLGDTIAKITKFTGIDKLVDGISKVTGKDCGCEDRKNSLNEKFPYKKTRGFFK